MFNAIWKHKCNFNFQIESYIYALADRYPKMVTRRVIGHTENNHNIHMLIITNSQEGGHDKPVVLMDGGKASIQEWLIYI